MAQGPSRLAAEGADPEDEEGVTQWARLRWCLTLMRRHLHAPRACEGTQRISIEQGRKKGAPFPRPLCNRRLVLLAVVYTFWDFPIYRNLLRGVNASAARDSVR